MEIGQYHGVIPDWRRTTTTKRGELYGIELEIEHVFGRQEAADALDGLDFGKYPAPQVERDGSLDPQRGLEIICPPLPLAEVTSEEGYIAGIMRRLRGAGVPPEQRTGCGMHVNVNVEAWTPQEKLLVQWALNAFANLGSVIGRRGPSSDAASTFGKYTERYLYTRQIGGALALSTYAGGKHLAAWLRSPGAGMPAGTGTSLVLEARFPRSTLEIKDLHTAIDYITAVRDWVIAAPHHTQAAALLARASGRSSVLEMLFYRWCRKYRPTLFPSLDAAQLLDRVGSGKRLSVVQRSFEDAKVLNENTGIRATEQGDKEQILRVSTLLSKGAELEGEPDEYGRIIPSTIRVRR